MIAKESRRVKTLSGFMKWVAQFNDGQYLFRGVSNEKYKIQASASRRLGENGDNPDKLLKINKEMISDARLEGHDQKNGQPLSELELLAELQHYGAATCLIDFTYSAQVALWMACQERSEEKVNGKVFAVRSDDTARFIKVTSDTVKEKLDYFFRPDERRLYQWQPKQQNNRIIAQQSIFLFGRAKIQAEAECIILKNNKGAILTSLEKLSGITEKRMFPDFDGFARIRAHDRLYVEPNVQDFLQRGIALHQEGRVDDAIAYYDQITSLEADKDTISSALYHRAFSLLEESNNSDLSIEHLSMAIQLKPDFAEAYKERGFIYLLSKKDANLAIADLNEYIHLKPNDAEAYYFRGVSWLFLQNWEKAKAEFDVAQNMGFNIAYWFSTSWTVEEFKEDSGVELPEDIITLLYNKKNPNLSV